MSLHLFELHLNMSFIKTTYTSFIKTTLKRQILIYILRLYIK